jgi:hypothetical protein
MPQNRSIRKSAVKVEYDDRGGVSSVTLHPKEVMRRGWLHADWKKIPPVFREEVRRHREAYERMQFQKELRERFPEEHRRGASRFWLEIESRQPQISEWLHRDAELSEATSAAGPEA